MVNFETMPSNFKSIDNLGQSNNCTVIKNNEYILPPANQEDQSSFVDLQTKVSVSDVMINAKSAILSEKEDSHAVEVVKAKNQLNIEELNNQVSALIIKKNSQARADHLGLEIRDLKCYKKHHSEIYTNDVPTGRFIQSFGGAGYLPPVEGDCELPLEEWKGREGVWMFKNLALLGFSFMVHYIAMKGANNLQSSVNAEKGLGTAALTAYYAGFLFSNVFLPAVIIRLLGCKLTLAVSILSYLPYIAAQYWPSFYTLMPGGILAGLAAGPLWVAQGTYLSHIAEVYAYVSGKSKDVIMSRAFGTFYMMYQMSQVWGNLISSEVLSYGDINYDTVVSRNGTGDVCGANFCPSVTGTVNLKLGSPPQNKIYLITSIYLASMVLASFIILLGMDSIKRTKCKGKSDQSAVQVLAATLHLLAYKEQWLLIPLTAWLGIQDAFLAAEYTSSYVSCAWGIRHIGYVMICYGVANCISAFSGGLIVKVTGRLPVVAFATVVQTATVATLLLWKPDPEHVILFFTLAALWGVTDGIWQAQINAMYGIMFPGKEEAAYSGFRLWEGVGYIISFGYSSSLCTNMKLYILLSIMVVGVIGFTIIEHGLRAQARLLKSKVQGESKPS